MFLCIHVDAIAGNSDGNTSPVSATAEIDKTPISIGDKIKYTITVNAPKEYEVRFPDFGDNLADFSIQDFGSSEGGIFTRTYSQWYILDTYETGTLTIPAVSVQYRKNNSNEWREIAVDAITVEVTSLLDDADQTASIRGIRGPRSMPDYFYLSIFLAVVLLAIIAVLVILYIKQKKKQRDIIIPRRPAHEIAYEALNALKNKDLAGTGKVKEYYFELSDIVRHYLENRFSLKAPEMTTEEFLYHLRETDQLRQDHKGLLGEFLSQCDLVKFAKYLPEKNEIESSFASAKGLVDQTKEHLVRVDTR